MKDCYDKDKCLVMRNGKAQLPCLYSWGMKGDTCIIKAKSETQESIKDWCEKGFDIEGERSGMARVQ